MGNLHASPFHCTRALPPLSHASAPVSSISPSTAAWLHSPKHACASVNDTAILQRPSRPTLQAASSKKWLFEVSHLQKETLGVSPNQRHRKLGRAACSPATARHEGKCGRAGVSHERESNVPAAASDRWASVKAAAAVRLTGLQIVCEIGRGIGDGDTSIL